ncbi:MAG: hypothetical protein R2747_11170 [Pyrinomonadaceae bacterium]
MINNSKRFLAVFISTCFAVLGWQNAPAQSGGAYQITQSVITGGDKSSGGVFEVEETSGQFVAGGFMQTSPFSVYSGFWSPPDLAPTAAMVKIGGRVRRANGQGIGNSIVILTTSTGVRRTSRSNPFGYYGFADVEVGETYILSVFSREVVFRNPIQTLIVTGETGDIDFVSEN